MALPLSNDAEGGSDTVSISTANSGGASGDAWDTVTAPGGSGGSMTYSVDHPSDGVLGWKFVEPNVSGFAGALKWAASIGTITEFYGGFYTYRATLNAVSTHLLLSVQSAGSRRAEININTTGKLRAVNSANTTVATSTNNVPLTELVRIDFHYRAGAVAGRIEVQMFHGDDTSPIEALAMDVDANTGASADGIQFAGSGAAVAGGYIWYADNLRLSATDWTGPGPSWRPLKPRRMPLGA